MIGHHEAVSEGVRVVSMIGFGGVSAVLGGGLWALRRRFRDRWRG